MLLYVRRCTVNLFRRKLVILGLLLTLLIAFPASAQTLKANDDTTLRQIIIFGRHSIRSSTVSNAGLDQFSADPTPGFPGVPVGYLTPRGQQAAQLLGTYFNEYLTDQGLLTGNQATDLARSYFHANSIQRSNITAAFFGTGLIPGSTVPVHSFELGTPDPVFDPVAAGLVTVDSNRAVAEAEGVYGSGADLEAAYSAELALVSSVLYPPGTTPINPPGSAPAPGDPPGLQGSYNPAAIAIKLEPVSPVSNAGAAIWGGGLYYIENATDPFVMQYADNFGLSDVAWGRLTPDTLSQKTRLTVLGFNIKMGLPYLARKQSSNAASHIARTMLQAVWNLSLRGAFGDRTSRIVVVVSSDAYVAGVAGLLGLHWTLPGYQPDFCSPGGALVFELRQNNKTMEYVVRVYYTSQTFDQLRDLTLLSAETPPATMQLLVPGGSNSATDLDVKWTAWREIMRGLIDQKSVEPYWKDNPPGVLTNVPLD
jgi:4-phytase / acid phosphatase